MAKRNPEGARAGANGVSQQQPPQQHQQLQHGKPGSPARRGPPSPPGGRVVTQRQSPSRSPPGAAPPSAAAHAAATPQRVSPGLAAGHYAGCKWTEPPLPAALPLPPQHWMQAAHSPAAARPRLPPYRAQPHQRDFAQQLKVLLKVHA